MEVGSKSVVAITGASRGIGRAAAISFARRGAKIVLASRDMDRLAEVEKRVTETGGTAISVPCDVSLETSCHTLIDEAIRRFGQVDVLINNAGFGHYATVERLTTGALEAIFRTNLYGSIWCVQAVLPHMKKRGKGYIVNVSTIISIRSLPFSSAYCMTKFAMNAFDESLRIEVRPYGIGVSLVCPGLTATDFQDNAGKAGVEAPVSNQKGMSAARVGDEILRAVQRNKRHVFLTWPGKIMRQIQRLSPGLMDRILERYFARFHKPST